MDSRKFLTDDERATLEASLRARLETDTRNVVMILTALYTGARASELLALTWNDVNTRTGGIKITTLKGGRQRGVKVPKFLRAGLERLKAMSPARPFDLSYNRLGEIWREYRTCQKPLHALRHTFAVDTYTETRDVHFTMRALGHRNIQNTMIYTDLDCDEAEFGKRMRVR